MYLLLLACIAGVYGSLWFGSHGNAYTVRLTQELRAAQALNRMLSARNAALKADLQDLKEGGDAIEELARRKLNWLGDHEVMVQVLDVPKGDTLHKRLLTPLPAQQLQPVIIPKKHP